MFSDEYEDEEQEEKEQGNFLVNFYNNNKLLVWIFLAIIILIIVISLWKKGGSGGESKIDYEVTIYPEGEVHVNIARSSSLIASVKNDPKAQIVWSVEDEKIATVSNGTVVGVGYGTTNVIAQYFDSDNKEYKDTKTVVVADGDPNVTLTDVSFPVGDLFMPINTTYQIALSLNPSNAYVLNETFTSSDPNVATVDSAGIITAIDEGTAIIYFEVNDGQFREELTVHVSSNYSVPEIIVLPDKISFDGEVRKIKIGNTEKLTYTISPPVADTNRLIWESSDPTVATIENGMVTALAEGRTVITVKAINGVADVIDVEVEKDIIEVTDIELEKENINLTIGEIVTITPKVVPDDASNKTLIYTSMDDYIAYVEPNDTGTQAEVIGIGEGNTQLVVTSTNGVYKYINVNVTDPYGVVDEWDVWDEDYEEWIDTVGTWNGGSSGSTSSYAKQGFEIHSYDAEKKQYVNATYAQTKPVNNGAIAPVTITVRKTNPDVDKLKILVCYYASSSTCGGIKNLETSDEVTFTLNMVGEFVIRVNEYDADGELMNITDKYIWIKQYNTAACRYTDKSACEEFYGKECMLSNGCYVLKTCNQYAPYNCPNYCKKTVSHCIPPCSNISQASECVIRTDCSWDYTNYCHDKTNIITEARINCTSYSIRQGGTVTCEASLENGDSIITWLVDGVEQNKSGNTFTFTSDIIGDHRISISTTKSATVSGATIKVIEKQTTTATPKVNYGCCYKVNNTWTYNSNYDWCSNNGHTVSSTITRDICLAKNSQTSCLQSCHSSCDGASGNTKEYCNNYCDIRCGLKDPTPTPTPKPTATPTPTAKPPTTPICSSKSGKYSTLLECRAAYPNRECTLESSKGCYVLKTCNQYPPYNCPSFCYLDSTKYSCVEKSAVPTTAPTPTTNPTPPPAVAPTPTQTPVSYRNVGQCSNGLKLKSYEQCTIPSNMKCRISGSGMGYVTTTMKTTTAISIECIKDISSLSFICNSGDLIIKDGGTVLDTAKYCTYTSSLVGQGKQFQYSCTGKGNYYGTKYQTCTRNY